MIKLAFIIFIGAAAVHAKLKNEAFEYFPNINGNLTKITWAHAVNNKSLLEEALSSEIMMIEADIVLGTLTNTTSNESIPIMGHPPADTSDLSLEQFLDRVLTYNSKTARKGIKLDFKTIEVFSASISILENIYSKISYPIWLNADILAGPLNATTIPVNATEFLIKASPFTNSTLSIGWTTNYGANISASYREDQIKEMLDTIQSYNVTQNITFPVRAGIAAESISELSNLLKNVFDSTLTLWSSEGDAVNVTNLRKLIQTVGINRTYVDVPQDLLSDLHLETISGSTVQKSFLVTILASVLFALIF